jgi:hypothetical protein
MPPAFQPKFVASDDDSPEIRTLIQPPELARPAGLEPATHSLEVDGFANDFNGPAATRHAWRCTEAHTIARVLQQRTGQT